MEHEEFLHFFHWTIITTHSVHVHVSTYTQYSNSHTGLTTTRTTLVFLLVTIQPVYLARDHLYIYTLQSSNLYNGIVSLFLNPYLFLLPSLSDSGERGEKREGGRETERQVDST